MKIFLSKYMKSVLIGHCIMHAYKSIHVIRDVLYSGISCLIVKGIGHFHRSRKFHRKKLWKFIFHFFDNVILSTARAVAIYRVGFQLKSIWRDLVRALADDGKRRWRMLIEIPVMETGAGKKMTLYRGFYLT